MEEETKLCPRHENSTLWVLVFLDLLIVCSGWLALIRPISTGLPCEKSKTCEM